MAATLDDIIYLTQSSYNLMKGGQAHIFINQRNTEDNRILKFMNNSNILERCFKSFNFDTKVHFDKKKDEIWSILETVAATPTADMSCVIVVVLTLSLEDKQNIWALDKVYNVEELVQIFSNSEDFPKLFFIQDVDNKCSKIETDASTSISASLHYKNIVETRKINVGDMFDVLTVRKSSAVIDDYIEFICKTFDENASNTKMDDILKIIKKNYPEIECVNNLVKDLYFKKTKVPIFYKEQRTPCENSDSDYPMNNKVKAYIFNHNTFDQADTRKGSIKDTNDLEKCFKSLNYDVEVYNNLTTEVMTNKMNEIESVKYTEDNKISCLIIIVMTHGKVKEFTDTIKGTLKQNAEYICGELQSTDSNAQYKMNFKGKTGKNKIEGDPITIEGEMSGNIPGKCQLLSKDKKFDLEIITERKFENLKNVPKLFFIQACRKIENSKPTNNNTLATDNPTSNSESEYNIFLPNRADTLIMHSCSDDEYSHRDIEEGTWFIQSLCETLNEKETEIGILDLLTKVIRKIVIKNDKTYMQMPQIITMLTKNLFLFKKHA